MPRPRRRPWPRYGSWSAPWLSAWHGGASCRGASVRRPAAYNTKDHDSDRTPATGLLGEKPLQESSQAAQVRRPAQGPAAARRSALPAGARRGSRAGASDGGGRGHGDGGGGGGGGGGRGAPARPFSSPWGGGLRGGCAGRGGREGG